MRLLHHIRKTLTWLRIPILESSLRSRRQCYSYTWLYNVIQCCDDHHQSPYQQSKRRHQMSFVHIYISLQAAMLNKVYVHWHFDVVLAWDLSFMRGHGCKSVKAAWEYHRGVEIVRKGCQSQPRSQKLRCRLSEMWASWQELPSLLSSDVRFIRFVLSLSTRENYIIVDNENR